MLRGINEGASFLAEQGIWRPGLGLKLGFSPGPVLGLTFREGGGGVLSGSLGEGPSYRDVALLEGRPFSAVSSRRLASPSFGAALGHSRDPA